MMNIETKAAIYWLTQPENKDKALEFTIPKELGKWARNDSRVKIFGQMSNGSWSWREARLSYDKVDWQIVFNSLKGGE